MRDFPPTVGTANSRVAVGSLFGEARAVPADVTLILDPDGWVNRPGRMPA